jgi:hypothetical protein
MSDVNQSASLSFQQRCSACGVLRSKLKPGGQWYSVCPFSLGDGHRWSRPEPPGGAKVPHGSTEAGDPRQTRRKRGPDHRVRVQGHRMSMTLRRPNGQSGERTLKELQ